MSRRLLRRAQSLASNSRLLLPKLSQPVYSPNMWGIAIQPSLPTQPPDPIEEECLPHYNSRSFFPVKPGIIYRGNYKTIAKLGYGGGSTVWLAQDLKLHLLYFMSDSRANLYLDQHRPQNLVILGLMWYWSFVHVTMKTKELHARSHKSVVILLPQMSHTKVSYTFRQSSKASMLPDQMAYMFA